MCEKYDDDDSYESQKIFDAFSKNFNNVFKWLRWNKSKGVVWQLP